MRRINAKQYEVWEVNGQDEYGQPSKPHNTGRVVECNIAMSNQITFEENIKFVNSYYTGLTWEKGLEVGQELRRNEERFVLSSVNEDARLVQLVLDKR